MRFCELSVKLICIVDVLIVCLDNNVMEYIFEKIGVDLYRRLEYLFGILKNVIMDYFDEMYGKNVF